MARRHDSIDSPPRYDDCENGSSQLPEYTCSVLLVAPLLLKCEFDTPFNPSLVRNWERVIAILRGTKLEFRKKGRRVTFGLQSAEVGLALDYRRRSNVIRVRAEGYQFLLAMPSLAESLRWIEGISISVTISDPIEERSDRVLRTFPRRKPFDPSIDSWDDFRRRWREVRRRSSKQQRWLRGEPKDMKKRSIGSALKDPEAFLLIVLSGLRKAGSLRSCTPRTVEAVEIMDKACVKNEHDRPKPLEACSVQPGKEDINSVNGSRMGQTGAVVHVDSELDYAKRCAPRGIIATG
ncbi:uncharacterized protein MYCFIDRAFT_171161 [Pseudocercospora fijiensis CIRAD86]|uniref:PH domain-containing protein n=1 Tax=Pseudocercospora fijiensis (strain CIRAD86) TaxID=383855 RepID=N1QC05_PSEFD|nr:uncharacterized protein MYCFIDRAFT_171161 [Pseudocercospora fijiensis CIRAD86]EME89766.1 hypothetical protein MYCFIDRAFT_171161 [Pseudocercospora fijiensis CIRAD86]